MVKKLTPIDNGRIKIQFYKCCKAYSEGAYKREEVFRNTIESNGKSRKHNIANRKESVEKLSVKMKEKILSGQWTPCVTNSWTHSRIIIQMNDIVYRFRSTFEAIFWLEFKNLIYEKIRIPYILNNKKHTYIVDFVDEDNKILYEIKPACLVDDERNIVKFKSAKEWCIKNNYEFKIVTENDITQNLHILNQKDMEIINNNTKLLNSYINFNKRLCNDAYDCLSS